ncbi:hypothetical protein BGZ61DRAFT_69375 [Ilyonectria robusta]|uniref:uncharacterized protein n=1 Tax=Ilyonectria robusta TaxID=1079257 RepID=UPI001E8E16C9|nr:uncharacterized protein BGZ61DRAFT_69375 [Ilyonectria robusta]KAH8679236.1 hypothetical protein BGZ61DRAFT_69375 [Ilyonectria robusta]
MTRGKNISSPPRSEMSPRQHTRRPPRAAACSLSLRARVGGVTTECDSPMPTPMAVMPAFAQPWLLSCPPPGGRARADSGLAPRSASIQSSRLASLPPPVAGRVAWPIFPFERLGRGGGGGGLKRKGNQRSRSPRDYQSMGIHRDRIWVEDVWREDRRPSDQPRRLHAHCQWMIGIEAMNGRVGLY